MLKEVLNPFSEEALKIVNEAPPLGELPKSVFNLALGKISSEEPGEFLLDQDYREDILSFHLLLAAAAVGFGSYSKESRLVTEVIKKIISSRIGYLIGNYAHDKNTYDEGVIASIFSQFFDVATIKDVDGLDEDLRLASASMNPEDILRYGVPLFKILPALSTRKVRLTELYIVKGHALLSLRNLIFLSELILEALLKTHLEKIPKSKNPPEIPELKPLADAISAMASNPDEYLGKLQKKIYFAVKPGAFIGKTVKGGIPLKPESFPPCIALTLQGVSSGSRNYAITVLLTSFISYARIAPVGSKKDARISDYTGDVKVVEEEVLPVIYEAAERCSPSLFADQPLEKMNILYHLGFGLGGEARLEHAGRSNWYFPPNCDKVRREAPALCRPDAHCREIKNPLSYYTKKLFSKREKNK
jgi:DNA primase large subunit